MGLGRKKDKDKAENEDEKKERKEKKEKKEKRLSLRKGSSPSRKRTIKARFEIGLQGVSNLPPDLNASVLFLSWKRGAKKTNKGETKRVQAANGRCAWGEDQPAIPILATIVQNKNRFSDKKLQLTLHCQLDKKLGQKVGEWELQLADYAPDGTDKTVSMPAPGKSANPPILSARVRTVWLKVDNKAIISRTPDGNYDLASESDASDAEGDTSIDSDVESEDATDLSDEEDEDDDFEMVKGSKIEKRGSRVEKRGSKIFGRSDKEDLEKKQKEEKEREKERLEKDKSEREENKKKELEEKGKREKEQKVNVESEEQERKDKAQREEKEQLDRVKEEEEVEKLAKEKEQNASEQQPSSINKKEGDLSFAAGDIIQITRKNERWWEGTLKTGQKGIFSSNYVAEISQREEAMYSSSSASILTTTNLSGLPPPPSFSRPSPESLMPPPTLSTPPTIPSKARQLEGSSVPPEPSVTASPAHSTPPPLNGKAGVVSPPYSPPSRRPPLPNLSVSDKESRETTERQQKGFEEQNQPEEQVRTQKKEREEKEREERKSRIEGARALFECGSHPNSTSEHSKVDEKKAKIFQAGSLGARIESLSSKKSDSRPTSAPPGNSTLHSAEESERGTAGQESKLLELERKLNEVLNANQKLQIEKVERVKEMETKVRDLEWLLNENSSAKGRDADKGKMEIQSECKELRKKLEEKEREISKLKNDRDMTVNKLREEKDKELTRLREQKEKEMSTLRKEKEATVAKLVKEEVDSSGKAVKMQQMLTEKNQEIWELREALARKDMEISQAVSRGARETEAVSRQVQELEKRLGEQNEELTQLHRRIEEKDKGIKELQEKSKAPASPRSRPSSLNPAEFELQKKQVEALSQQVSTVREDNTALTQKLSEKEKELREEKKQSDGLRSELERAQREKADAKAALDRERSEREQDLRLQKESGNDEVAGLHTEINRLLEDKRGLSMTNDNLRNDLDKLQTAFKMKQEKIMSLKEKANGLKEQLRNKDEELDSMKAQLEERVNQIERLKGHVEEHSGTVDKLREELTIKTEELLERDRVEKTEVGKESLLQQKTTKLEKMVRGMHVDLNVKKQSLKKAIKQSEQKEFEIRRLKEKVEQLKQQLEEVQSGEKDKGDSDSEESEDEEVDKKSKRKKKSKNEDEEEEDDEDDSSLEKALKKAEIKKDVLKQRLEKLDFIERTILTVEIQRKNEDHEDDGSDSDDEREPGDGGEATEVAQDLFWFLEKNSLFDRDLTDQHLLNHIIDALEATLERCVGNTEYQAYYLSLVSMLIQSIIADEDKLQPFHIDEDLLGACRCMDNEGIVVVNQLRAPLDEEQAQRRRLAINLASSRSNESPPISGGQPDSAGQPPIRGGRMEGARGRGGFGRGIERSRGAPMGDVAPPNRGGRAGPPRWPGPTNPGRGSISPAWDSQESVGTRGGRGGPPDVGNPSGPQDGRGGRGVSPPPEWNEPHVSSDGGGRSEVQDEANGNASTAKESKAKRPELRRTATGDSLLSSFLRRLYFVAERIFIEMHAKVMKTIFPLLIPAILSHPNAGGSATPPKPGGRVQNLPSPAEMSGAGSDRMPPTEEDVTRCLDTVFLQLSAHTVFPAIMQQFAETVFYSINVVLFNFVIQRPELCTCSNGFKMKWGIARLVSWLFKEESEPYSFLRPEVIENQLLLMTEAATLLVMDKAIFAKPQAVRRQFVELSGQQLRALLFNFRPDPMAPGRVAEEWRNTARMMAAREGGPLFLVDPFLSS